jgi:hypothetical protein
MLERKGWSFIALSAYPQAIDFSTPVFGGLTALGGSFFSIASV